MKKITAIALLLCMLLSLTGCGQWYEELLWDMFDNDTANLLQREQERAMSQAQEELSQAMEEAKTEILDGLVTLVYDDLETSFREIAAPYILTNLQDYVLEAIKYHLESSDGFFRVARNLFKLNLSKEEVANTGNLLFFFDGVSTNLAGATTVKSGFTRAEEGDRRYNVSAVCIVVQAGENYAPKVVFACPASTIPDNVRAANLNLSNNRPKAVPIVQDGIYDAVTKNHPKISGTGRYASLNIKNAAVVRCSGSEKSYYDQSQGINIHRRGNDSLTDTSKSSVGCFNIGNDKGAEVYEDFIKTITGQANASTTSYTEGKDMGLVIVDRSNYLPELKIIYGDDPVSGGLSAEEVVALITDGSAQWHEDIMERLEKKK